MRLQINATLTDLDISNQRANHAIWYNSCKISDDRITHRRPYDYQ